MGETRVRMSRATGNTVRPNSIIFTGRNVHARRVAFVSKVTADPSGSRGLSYVVRDKRASVTVRDEENEDGA